MRIETILVRGAHDPHNDTGAVAVPIYQSATFSHPGVGKSTGFDYARSQNPTREPLERQVALLENGTEAMAFASGMAALDALMGLFAPGDHLLATADLYGGSVRLFDVLTRRVGLKVDYLDTNDARLLKEKIRPETRGVFLETPSNPMTNVTDIRMVKKTVGEDILVVADNTFLTPYLQRPLDLGADLVLHSGTKYLGGHNDTLAGFIVTRSAEMAEKLRFITKTVGTGLAPFDSFLILRGLKTLHLRMERAEENARAAALFLQGHPHVERVFYPGLPEHPGRLVSQTQASGFGAMLSFEVDSARRAEKLLETVTLILYAESLGGVETLVTYPFLQTHADVPEATRLSLGITDRLLRLSMGVENSQDLLDDLERALK
ncbi:MAG: PLP-dependent aspartate aminotransferase family protein [Deltaproteobacteria bacterium]|jgi:cystathionine gamma-synthase|nr:PLP-dependent aspartate aminotransferase family protein [Deltaproteobacteria bacterium]